MAERYPWFPCLAWIALALMISLQASNGHGKPTSYLHSWNQISTLATARAIAEGSSPWWKPRDVVTRLSWLPKEGEASDNKRRESISSGDAFTAYEEFPLYHLIVAAIASSTLPPGLETAAHRWSTLMFVLACLGFARLVRDTQEEPIAEFVFFTSFPLVYYGQATMSDMSMLCCVVWFFTLRARATKNRAYDLLSCCLLAVGGLFKSYAIVFSLVFLFELLPCKQDSDDDRAEGSLRRSVWALLLFTISCLPVLCWHYFASLQSGHQETVSHSLDTKLGALLNGELYSTIFKMLFRYLGYLPGACLLLLIALALLYRSGLLLKAVEQSYAARLRLAWRKDCRWLSHWLLCGTLYLLATSDKLLHHDYYFLLIAPPMIVLASRSLLLLEGYCSERWGQKAGATLLILFALSNFAVSAKSVWKAQKSNPDVDVCAKLVRENTPKSSLVGMLTDVSRYNSLAYYSKRNGITIEHDAVPLKRYTQVGMQYLTINLPPDEARHYETWMRGQEPNIMMIESRELKDFKERPRQCALYRIP